MYSPSFLLPRLSALLLLYVLPFAKAADLSSSYDWSRMKIGGGGWVVGMSINPAEKDLIYARTDVSGAYRWEPATSSWKQVVTSASLPAEWVGYGRYAGVDSIVGAPSDANIAYMAFTGQAYGLVEGQIFRSTNKGDTWTPTKFKETTKVKMEPNGEGRQAGERLSVDPVNSNVVYFASIKDGLWKTDNGGESWTKVAAIPSGIAPHGVTTVIFDRKSGTTKSEAGIEKTNGIFVSVEEGGVFRTNDAGATWNMVSESGPPKAGKPRDATMGPDGTYYVVFDGEKGGLGAVWKYSPAGAWTDITPQAKEGGNDKSYWAIAIDPFDPNHVVAMIHGGKTFVSVDQGASWSFHLFKLESANVKWLGTQTNYFLSTGHLAFDPYDQGKLWYAEGFGMWWTRDLNAIEIPWQAASEGIEEVCGNDVIAPPGGKPVGAMFDVGAFYFDDVDSYTAQRSQPGFMSTWSLDWCAKDPKFLVAVFRSHLDFIPKAKSSGFSTDGGQTWTRFAALENDTLPDELDYGVIAVASDNPDHIVWSPAAQKLPYYTHDRGVTWKQASFGGSKETGMGSFFTALKPLCADRVEPDTFYCYTPQEGVFRSTDGGMNFGKVGDPSPNRWNAILKTTPGHAKDLWFAAGQGGGLSHSTDGGTTWTQIAGVEMAFNMGLGKAKEEGGYPTLFIAGIVSGNYGIFRSTDQGVSWDKIVDYPVGVFDFIDAMDGDKDIFGQVYICFSGSGFAYGKPNATKK